MKRIIMFLAVAVLLLSVSSQSIASLTTGDLVRVVYKNGGVGSEVATDLTSALGWTTPISGNATYSTDNFSLGQFSGAAWGDLSVSYYANTTAGSFWFSGPDGGMDNHAGKLASVRTGLTQMNGVYSTAMGTGKQGTILSSDASSYWNKTNLGGTNIGSFAGFVEPDMGVESLADLATVGYVDQYLYYYPNTSSNYVGTGVKLAKIRTFADGHTELSSVQQCVPSQETCDGIDNDCDGQIDEGLTRASTCGTGECGSSGTETCVLGVWSNNTCIPGNPTAEICDNKDNNCDGQTDNGIAAVPTTCGVGECGNTGSKTCIGGALVDSCTPKASTTEVCDGKDNNCDGQTDNGIAAVPTTCGVGACQASGQSTCQSGQMVDSCTAGQPGTEGPFGNPTCSDAADNDCDGKTDAADSGCVQQCVASQEICDGIDNNCDGQTDNGIAAVPTTCGVGACQASGQSTCQNGQMVNSCTAGQPGTEGPFGNPTCSDVADNDCDGKTDAADSGCVQQCVASQEVCDGIDNNCDGQIDNGIAAVPTTCGQGACTSTGQKFCQGGQIVDSCTPGNPTGNDDNCNSVDENCNGTSDENYVPTSTSCGQGECAAAGQEVCENGQGKDTCVPRPSGAEGPSGDLTCSDGKDNDCDGKTDVDDPDCVQRPDPADADRDGVIDSHDKCPNTPQYVIANHLVGSTGCVNCKLLDEYVDLKCSPTYKNHGAYVSCAAKVVSTLVVSRQITGECAGQIIRKRSESDFYSKSRWKKESNHDGDKEEHWSDDKEEHRRDDGDKETSWRKDEDEKEHRRD